MGDPEMFFAANIAAFRDRRSSPAAWAKPASNLTFYSGAITDAKDMLKAVMKKSIEAGLAPDAALRALTLSPPLPRKFLESPDRSLH